MHFQIQILVAKQQIGRDRIVFGNGRIRLASTFEKTLRSAFEMPPELLASSKDVKPINKDATAAVEEIVDEPAKEDKYPISESCKALYPILSVDESGEHIGVACVLLRLTCFGSSVASPFAFHCNGTAGGKQTAQRASPCFLNCQSLFEDMMTAASPAPIKCGAFLPNDDDNSNQQLGGLGPCTNDGKPSAPKSLGGSKSPLVDSQLSNKEIQPMNEEPDTMATESIFSKESKASKGSKGVKRNLPPVPPASEMNMSKWFLFMENAFILFSNLSQVIKLINSKNIMQNLIVTP